MLSLFVAVAAPLAVFLRGRPAAQAGEHNLQSAIRHAMADRSFHYLFWSYAVCGFHRSEEHTSELQSLMRISYAVFCLKKKKNQHKDKKYKYQYTSFKILQ